MVNYLNLLMDKSLKLENSSSNPRLNKMNTSDKIKKRLTQDREFIENLRSKAVTKHVEKTFTSKLNICSELYHHLIEDLDKSKPDYLEQMIRQIIPILQEIKSNIKEQIKESYVENYDDDDMILEASMMDYSNEELWVRGMPSRMIVDVTAKFLKGGINGRVQLALNNWKKMYNDPQTPLMNVKRAVSNVAVQLREYLQKVAAHEDPSDNKNTALRILSSMLEAQRTNDPNKIVIS